MHDELFEKTVSYVHSKLNHCVDIEDIRQDLLLKYGEAKKNYDLLKGSFKNYWRAIVKNYIREVVRGLKASGCYVPVIKKYKKQQKPFYKYLYVFEDKETFHKYYKKLDNIRQERLKIIKKLIILTDYLFEDSKDFVRYDVLYHKR